MEVDKGIFNYEKLLNNIMRINVMDIYTNLHKFKIYEGKKTFLD